MNYPVFVDLWRTDALRQATERTRRAIADGVGRVPGLASAVPWLQANRREVAAIGSLLLGTLLIAAGGGLL